MLRTFVMLVALTGALFVSGQEKAGIVMYRCAPGTTSEKAFASVLRGVDPKGMASLDSGVWKVSIANAADTTRLTMALDQAGFGPCTQVDRKCRPAIAPVARTQQSTIGTGANERSVTITEY